MTNPETRKTRRQTAESSVHQLSGLSAGSELVVRQAMDEVDGNGWTDVRHLDNERDYYLSDNDDSLTQTTDTVGDGEDEVTLETCSSFSLQECINEFKARRIRRTSTHSRDVVVEKEKDSAQKPLDSAEVDLIKQNRTNKEHERKYKPCKNGFCYCFTSDSGDGVVASAPGVHVRHQRRSRKSENCQVSETIPQPNTAHRKKERRRQSAPASLKIPTTKQASKPGIRTTTTFSDQIKAISRLGTAPKNAPLIHIIQELHNNCVISEVRVNKHKVQVHRSRSLSAKPSPTKSPLYKPKKADKEISDFALTSPKKFTPSAPPLEKISEQETVSDPFGDTTCLDTSTKSNGSRGRRHKAAGLLLQKRLSHAPMQFKPRNLTEPPPKPPRRSSVNSDGNRVSVSTLPSTTPSVREAEQVVDDFLLSQGIVCAEARVKQQAETKRQTHERRAQSKEKGANHEQWQKLEQFENRDEPQRANERTKHQKQETKSGGGGGGNGGATRRENKDSNASTAGKTKCRTSLKTQRAYPSLSDIERIVDKEKPADQPSNYEKNARSTADKSIKEHCFGWKVDESKVHQMLNYDANPNARPFRSQAVQAEPQTIGWQIPPKVALDTVDGGLRQNLDANISVKHTPIKENSPPLPDAARAHNASGLQKTMFRKQIKNLMPSPWSSKTASAVKAGNAKKNQSNLKKSSQNFLNNSKKRILRLVSPKKENHDPRRPPFVVRKTPLRSVAIQTSKEELRSLGSSSTPQSPPGSYFSAVQTSQQSTTPSNSQGTARTQEACEAKREQTRFNFDRTVHSPPKRPPPPSMPRKLNFPLPLNESPVCGDDMEQGRMTKTYRSFQSDLDQDATLSKMGFILSNIRAKLEASDNHAVRTFQEIGQREQQIAANLDCTDGLRRGRHEVRNGGQRQAHRHFIIDEREEPIYSEIEEDSIHISSSPHFDNKTGNVEDIPAEQDPSALYAKVVKTPKTASARAEKNACQIFQQQQQQRQEQLQQHERQQQSKQPPPEKHHQIPQGRQCQQEEKRKRQQQSNRQSQHKQQLQYEQHMPSQQEQQHQHQQDCQESDRYDEHQKVQRNKQKLFLSLPEQYVQKCPGQQGSHHHLPQKQQAPIQLKPEIEQYKQHLEQQQVHRFPLEYHYDQRSPCEQPPKQIDRQQSTPQKQQQIQKERYQYSQEQKNQQKNQNQSEPQKQLSPSSALAKCLQDLMRSKINLKPVPSKSPSNQTEIQNVPLTFHSSPSVPSSTASSSPKSSLPQSQSLNNIRVREQHSPPKYNRNLSKSDLSLHRSEIFLENLCRSELVIDGSGPMQPKKASNLNLYDDSYTSVNSPSESKNTTSSQQGDVIDGVVGAENEDDADYVSYEMPDDTANTDLSQSLAVGSQLDLNQSTPKKVHRKPQSFTTKHEDLIEQAQEQQQHEFILFFGDSNSDSHHPDSHQPENSSRSRSFPNSPRKLPPISNVNEPNECTTSLVEVSTSYTDSQSHPICCKSTLARYQRLKNALRNSLRKSKIFVKTETRRLSSSFSFPSAAAAAASTSTTTTTTAAAAAAAAVFNNTKIPSTRRNQPSGGEFFNDSSFNLDSLFALEDDDQPLQQQLAKAVSICRQLPDLEISPEMVEAERLLLYSTLRLQLTKFPPSDYVRSREQQQTRLYVDAMRIPIRAHVSQDLFFNYFYICTFYCGGVIRSTQSVECRNQEAIFSDCGIEFALSDSETEVKCEIFMLRLRKVSTISLERKRKPLNLSTSSMTSSCEDIVSRFRLHGSFTMRPIDFTPYEYVDAVSKASHNICLRSSASCKLPITPRTKSTNLTREVLLTGRADVRFPKCMHRGFLNVQESDNQHHWNRRWCTLDGMFAHVWQDVPQDEDMSSETAPQPLLFFDLRRRSREVSGSLECAARELCARPRSFALDCCAVPLPSDIGAENRSDITPATRTVFFSAESQSDLTDWLMKLNEALDFIAKWM